MTYALETWAEDLLDLQYTKHVEAKELMQLPKSWQLLVKIAKSVDWSVVCKLWDQNSLEACNLVLKFYNGLIFAT